MVPKIGVHSCVPVAKASPTIAPSPTASPNIEPQASPTSGGGYARNARWRAKNRKHYNDYMAAYRRNQRRGRSALRPA
jgi:hypothetical protein